MNDADAFAADPQRRIRMQIDDGSRPARLGIAQYPSRLDALFARERITEDVLKDRSRAFRLVEGERHAVKAAHGLRRLHPASQPGFANVVGLHQR